jgi:hypothetical protein
MRRAPIDVIECRGARCGTIPYLRNPAPHTSDKHRQGGEMKTPKMLPWLARKAGINNGRAEALWAEALEYVAKTPFEPRPGAGDHLAVRRLLMLIEAETRAMRPAPSEQSRQTRERWPVSHIAAIRSKAEDTLAEVAVS